MQGARTVNSQVNLINQNGQNIQTSNQNGQSQLPFEVNINNNNIQQPIQIVTHIQIHHYNQDGPIDRLQNNFRSSQNQNDDLNDPASSQKNQKRMLRNA